MWQAPDGGTITPRAFFATERMLHPPGDVAPTKAASKVGWAEIPNPRKRGQTIASYFAGNTVKAMAAANSGSGSPLGLPERYAIWNATGLQAGRYRVELFYLLHPANAACVAVQFKTTGMTAFPSANIWLNQKTGSVMAGMTKYTDMSNFLGEAFGSFKRVVTNLTPTHIPVRDGSSRNSGKISVKISDAMCAKGRIVADTVRLTWMTGL